MQQSREICLAGVRKPGWCLFQEQNKKGESATVSVSLWFNGNSLFWMAPGFHACSSETAIGKKLRKYGKELNKIGRSAMVGAGVRKMEAEVIRRWTRGW